jgi:hypothetical protein
MWVFFLYVSESYPLVYPTKSEMLVGTSLCSPIYMQANSIEYLGEYIFKTHIN